MDEWAAAYDLTGRILEEALSKNLQGVEIKQGNTKDKNGKLHDVTILDDYKVSGGNVLLQVNVLDFPYFLEYYEMAASLPRLPDALYPFPHPDFDISGFSIRPIIDIDRAKQRVILLLSKY